MGRPESQAKDGTLGLRGSLEVGVALFSMFFGAGNLIIAPLLGVQAGPSVVPATVGYLVSGVGLPIATIVAIAHAGTADALLDRIGRRFSRVFTILTYLAIGPLLAIPRTASTSFEMVRPLIVGVTGGAGGAGAAVDLPQLLFSLAFFAAALALALHPARIVRLMGKVTGPLLIALLVVMVAAQVVAPAGDPLAQAQQVYATAPGVAGFLQGYQTLDLLASLAFGVVITSSVRRLGVADADAQARQVARSGVVAGALMALVYCALSYLGARMGTVASGAANGAEVISLSATLHFGTAGTALTAAVFLIACFNVCVGLVSSIGEYFSKAFPKVPYRGWATIVACVSCVLANAGLTAILSYSVPVLMALYPMGICAMLMGLLPGSEAHATAWRLAMACVGVVSTAGALRDALAPGLALPLDALPLASIGLGWVVPGILGLVIGAVVEAASRGREGRGAAQA
ncbi:MAG: branched-chain amino acid transport system II carrier protein [Olsenella sp.]|jgi:LIVCS family branched-chain amino acid:cation transporter